MQISRTGGSPVQDEVTFSWSYLPGSDLKSSLSYPNGLAASWTYDANNQLLQVCNATPTNVISQYDYTYDAAGRRVSCAKSGSAFAHDDIVDYGYNARSELTNAVAAVDSNYRYSYAFDDIGNRESSSERGTNSVYTANSLNQYAVVDDFIPQFDDDGNQTLIKTAIGVWQVQYNGENRPVLWENVSTNSPTPNSPTPSLISMSFDRMGRRVTKNAQRFVYDGYLQIANIEHQTSNIKLQTFVWDPTEPIATRPLVWGQREDSTTLNFEPSTLNFYTHDGNKNVSEVIAENGGVAAQYEYTPFGAVAVLRGASSAANPWRFSCEYAEGDTATVYYNYRHYEPNRGRWMQRDPVGEDKGVNIFGFIRNNGILGVDVRGLFLWFWGSNFRKCPKGQTWTFKNIARVPKADGCSNPFKGWILGKAGEGIAKIFPGLPDYSGDPDAPFSGVSFLSACDYHDYCYSNCHKGKDDCDKGLRRLAKKACADAASKKSFSNQKERDDWVAKCDAWANAYYNAVKAAGQDSYENRQKKACECNCSKRDLRFGAFDENLEHYYPPITP
jgi:RHS repeat-associated protein